MIYMLRVCAIAVAFAFASMASTPVLAQQGAPAQTTLDPSTLSRIAALESLELAKEREEKSVAAKREANDLAAQESMAQSTKEIAGLTEWQVGISIATAVGLAVSIGFTWLTISQTRQVIRDNKKFSQVELRAYVGIAVVDILGGALGEPLKVRVSYKNYGSTPANNLRVFSQGSRMTGTPRAAAISLPGQLEYRAVNDLQPNERRSVSYVVTKSLTESDEEEFAKYSKSTLFALVVIYDDVFGQQHVLRSSGFRFGKALSESRANLSFATQNHRDIPSPTATEAEENDVPRRRWFQARSD